QLLDRRSLQAHRRGGPAVHPELVVGLSDRDLLAVLHRPRRLAERPRERHLVVGLGVDRDLLELAEPAHRVVQVTGELAELLDDRDDVAHLPSPPDPGLTAGGQPSGPSSAGGGPVHGSSGGVACSRSAGLSVATVSRASLPCARTSALVISPAAASSSSESFDLATDPSLFAGSPVGVTDASWSARCFTAASSRFATSELIRAAWRASITSCRSPFTVSSVASASRRSKSA